VISLMRHELSLRRRAIIGWAIGLTFFAVLYMSFFPAMPDEMLELDFESIEIYESLGVRNMSSFDGYMQSTVFNFLPLLAGVLGIILGVGTLAGEEDSGTLELLVTLPVSRTKLYVSKATALMLASGIVVAVAAAMEGIVFLLIESEIDTDVAATDLMSVVLAHWLIIFVFLALGMFLGSFLPTRGAALATSSTILVLTFFGNNLAGMVEALESVQPLFPFWYFMDVAESLTGDVPWDNVAVLLAMSAVPLVLGLVAFNRRDLMVGAWPWQRPSSSEAPGEEDAAWYERRRIVVPTALGALALCCCASTAVAAVAVSEDTRDSLRERLGLDVVVEADGELALARTDVPVSASGVISSVAVEAGEKVEEGDVLVVLTDVANGPSGLTPQQVQESAWLLLDELTAGSTDAPAEELSAAVLAADEAVTMTQLAVGEATDSGAGEEAVARLEEWARVALAARDIAEARLALAKDGPEAVDVGVIEEAMAVTELPSIAASSGESEWVVRAPVAGEVLDALPEEGAHVVIGQPVVSIRPAETTDALEIALSVTADDADQIEVGYAAEVVVDDRDDQFEGEVVGVRELDAAEADGDLTHVVIVLVRDRYGELEPGVTARVKIREQ